MLDPIFDHDKLDVYRLAIDYVADSFEIAKGLAGLHRHARDQWLRAAQSIPLNIAEGNGKRGMKDRARYFDIARGSALECAAIQDVLVISRGIEIQASDRLKAKLKRIVAMLTRLALRMGNVSKPPEPHGIEHDYEHEHESGVTVAGNGSNDDNEPGSDRRNR
jgi:four helix bundle protein